MIGIGISLFCFAVVGLCLNEIRLAKKRDEQTDEWVQGEGEIVSTLLVNTHEDAETITTYPYTVNGIPYQTSLTTHFFRPASSLATYQKGDKLSIRYNPNAPWLSCPANQTWEEDGVYETIVIAVVFFIGGILAVLVSVGLVELPQLQ